MTTDLFSYTGPTRLALAYAKMRRTNPFMPRDVISCFHTKFRRPSDVLRSLAVLQKHYFVRETAEGWLITEKGIQYLFQTARKSKDHTS